MLPMEESLNLLFNKAQHRLFDKARCASPWLIAPVRSLAGHENLGGHSCQRHVGKSVPELKSRLLSEPTIPSASTFWTIESATASVCYLTVTNILDIIDWGCSTRQRFTIEEAIPVRTSVGYSVLRGSNKVVLCKRARMVLEKDSGYDFHIVTAFPV